MNSRQRIRAIFNRQPHDRLGWDFHDAEHKDIVFAPFAPFERPEAEGLTDWGRYPELLERVPSFRGEVCMDIYGNILGRLEGKTKGECISGALQDGWELLDEYRFPTFDRAAYTAALKAKGYADSEKYVMGSCVSVFSVLRDVRRISNALADTIEEPENVEEFLSRLFDFTLGYLDAIADCGVDGVMIADDWGTQISTFISPRSFERLFQPAYARLAGACHERGLDLVLHSCGYVYPLAEMFADAGIDAFQFDQPELTGSRIWAEQFGRKAAFYCPVDIQKVLSTGDIEYIEKTALEMCNAFRRSGGNLVCKDYPTYGDIGVDPEWARRAEEVIVANSGLQE
ncbi:MAG: hypothetical protein J5827_00565 [Oscillospiraceae bacterium]|nr:hypothetical protein [Oscillospiraceae bacterium]